MTRKANDYWTSFYKAGLDLLYPPKCSLCGLFAAENPCIQCLGEMTLNEPTFRYLSDDVLEFEGIPYRYEGRAGQAVRRLKYSRCTGLAGFMADAIQAAVEAEGLEYDLAVPVPIHWLRLASRGFNQAELLTEKLPRRRDILRRVRATRPQAGLSVPERLVNLEGAFSASDALTGKRILLIDDVVTSGRTARECARVLRDAGAASVGLVAFCGEARSDWPEVYD